MRESHLRFIFLGTGAAYSISPDNYQSNMLIISDNNKKLLIDCGTDIRYSLHEQGYSFTDIDAVYISHLHSDHIGGVEWLGFCSKFIAHSTPTLFVSDDQVDLLWDTVLKGGMSSVKDEPAQLETFFNVHGIQPGGKFIWEDISFKLVKTIHVISDHHTLPSYGLFITYKQHKIFLTTDTQFDLASLEKFYLDADIIFHDCETINIKTGVHAHFDDLQHLPLEIKAKTWLYDYNEGTLPDANMAGFLGYLKKGQVFEF